MLNMIAGSVLPITAFIVVFFAFAATCILTSFLNDWLPRDMGREFAHNGKLSAGKPRGAGIIFISVFCIAALLFGEMSVEMFIYLVLVFVEMLTGFMDDAADEPWGEYKKGILDFLVAAVAALNYIHFNSTYVELATIGVKFYIPPSRIRINATNKNKKGLPVLSTAKLIKIPMARLPASPIIKRLGVALYHKYPRIHTTNNKIIYGNCVSFPRI